MVNLDYAIITVEDNKIRLTDDAIEALNAITGDRICINYYTVNCETSFPVIAKSTVFGEDDSGTKLTKSKTCSFRGVQRDILLEYGKSFKLEIFPKRAYYKLAPIEESTTDSFEEEENDLKKLDK